MGLTSWVEEKIHKFTILDYTLLKIALILLGIVIGAYISAFVKEYVWYFVIVFVILYAILIYKVFKK